MNKQDIHCPEKLPIVTGEYLYYKGIIRGLEEAEGKSKVEIDTLKKVYTVKTKKLMNYWSKTNGIFRRTFARVQKRG